MRALVVIAAIAIGTVSALASDNPEADLKKADHELNTTYKQIEARLADDQAAKSRLIHAQRAWIAFRDSECNFRSGGEDGGSIAPTIAALCRADMTTARTEQFKEYLNCEEGDLSCPVPAD